MTPDELLRRYPRETLCWLRRWLGLSQTDFARRIGVTPQTVAAWEAGRHGVRLVGIRRRLVALLAPSLATPGGVAFARSLGRGEAAE